MRKLVFATVVRGELYRRMFKVLVRSVLDHNRRCMVPWVVIHDYHRADCLMELKREYRFLEFHRADPNRYPEHIRKKDGQKLHASTHPGFYSFEIANPALDAEKVVYLDADMICDNLLDAVLRPTGRVCMFKEPKYDHYSAAVIVVNKPDQALYDWLLAQKHKESVNDGWGTDQNVWNQWPFVQEIHPRDETHAWAVKGYPHPNPRPELWHMIAKPGQKAKDAPPDSGGWKNTVPRVKKLWEHYDGWKPLYTVHSSEDRPFWIFSTGHNCEDYIENCIRSVQRQGENFRMTIVDDASTDATHRMAQYMAANDERIRVVRNRERLYGPRSRYEAIMSMEAKADDVILQLDLDDELLEGALTRIKLEYRERPDVWMTYGKLKDQNGTVWPSEPPSVLDGLKRRRKKMLCRAPRTFRAGLFWELGEETFKRGSQWMRCKFDQAATCAMQEMAGPDRMRAINHVIYRAQIDTPRQVWNAMRDEGELTRDYIIARPMRKRIKRYRDRRDPQGSIRSVA